MNTDVISTTWAGLPAADPASAAVDGAGVVDRVIGEAEVLPRADAVTRSTRVAFGPDPQSPTEPPAELTLPRRRRRQPDVDLPELEPGRVTFATAPTTTARPTAAPGSGDVAAPAPRSPASVVIGPPPTLSPPTPCGRTVTSRPTSGLTRRSAGGLTARPAGALALRPANRSLAIRGRSGGPDLLSRLLELLRQGRTRARGLTAQDKRVIAYLAVAFIIATGGQADPAAAAPVGSPTAPPAGAHVAAATQVLDLARAQIGTVEAPDGSTPYHQDYGLPADQPWCAIFLWDVFQDAGSADSIHPKTAFTPTLASWFRDRGQWTATPTVGALVFYDWPGDALDRIQHVGIVESFTPTTITTIEGNTSNSDAGSQDDGDGVWRRTRPRNASIVGYGLPTYGLAS